MSAFRRASLPLIVAAVGGCYHATIETGLVPSEQVVEDKWADGWVLGLVPPEAVETASRCPNGVARIETRLSFLNQLVGGLTFGIYTPMVIKVTCAAGVSAAASGEAGIEVSEGATMRQKQQALRLAADLASATAEPVTVRF